MSKLERIERIVVHHSASALLTTAADIRRWHTDPEPEGRGWSDIGYHVLIEVDGLLIRGRDVASLVTGAHALGVNQTSLGLCIIGNNLDPEEAWLGAQLATAREWIRAVRLTFGEIEVVGHRNAGATATECPGVSDEVLHQMLM